MTGVDSCLMGARSLHSDMESCVRLTCDVNVDALDAFASSAILINFLISESF